MIKQYLKSTSGNFAMMTAIGLSVMLVAVGAAVDFTSVTKQQQSLQDMVDNATLAAAQVESGRLSDMQALAEKVIAQHNTKNWPVKTEVKILNNIVYVEVSSQYETILMGMVGQNYVDIKVDAGAPIYKATPLNIALVLDTTGSMAGDNIKNLKVAAKDMVKGMKSADSSVRMAVVPFGQYVNVGVSNKNAPWIDTSKDGTRETYQQCYKDKKTRRQVCQTREIKYTWYGCAGSRQSPYNEQASLSSTRIPGIMNETCGTEMLPLNSNLDKVSQTIGSLNTKGGTYLPSGVIWGWRALQKDAPLIEVRKSYKTGEPDPVNAMVIMTDGENTLSQVNGESTHNGRDGGDANDRTAALCEAAKQDGIQIYTVGYRMGAGRGTMEKLLKSCASASDNFFDAKNASELKKAFNDIAGRLKVTRLTT